MEETKSHHHVLQVALNTLKERCQKLQERVDVLEEENIQLHIKCNKVDNAQMKSSISEIDALRDKVVELTEQKHQLHNKMKLVSYENQELWNKLGKLSYVNKTLGSHLNKISETLSQHSKSAHSPLIRSKTFTQDEPQTKVLQRNLEINGKISLELEDISLKIMDSFAREKNEFDSFSSQLGEMQYPEHVITRSFGFKYDEEGDDDMLKNLDTIPRDLTILKQIVCEQQDQLKLCLQYIDVVKDWAKVKKSTKISLDKSVGTNDYQTTPENKNDSLVENNAVSEIDKICPMCSRTFDVFVNFQEFQQHVESHFLCDNDSYELL